MLHLCKDSVCVTLLTAARTYEDATARATLDNSSPVESEGEEIATCWLSVLSVSMHMHLHRQVYIRLSTVHHIEELFSYSQSWGISLFKGLLNRFQSFW